jgi:preprotein translocase subunit SecD
LTLSGVVPSSRSVLPLTPTVLIFARLREELQRPAIESGSGRAFTRAWRQSEIQIRSPLSLPIVLIMFTTSVVKGFAVTLIIGVVISMVSAIIITRNFLKLIPAKWLETSIGLSRPLKTSLK